MDTSQLIPARLSAAAYMRMSTEHQRYSIAYQRSAITDYAAARGIDLVETYIDSGKSGVTIKRREGLQRLLSDVISGKATYRTILIYDVSRWGRFQDIDEGAHYEFVCRRAGVSVSYVAEVFANDGSPMASIVKSLKRVMAGEFSRELSVKVALVQARGASEGFWQGGRAPLGMSRVICPAGGGPAHVLLRGQQKFLRSDRVTLVPGPLGEIEIVRRIFRMFVEEKVGPTAIANRLNDEGLLTTADNRWSHSAVHDILKNLAYVGTYAFRKHIQVLGCSPVARPPEEWIRREHTFEPILDRKLFDAAQEIFRLQKDRLTRAEAIAIMRKVAKTNGTISRTKLMKATPWGSKEIYRELFGGMPQAYEAAGVQSRVNLAFVLGQKSSLRVNAELLGDLRSRLTEQKIEHTRMPRESRVTLADRREISIAVARPKRDYHYRDPVWIYVWGKCRCPNILVLACRGSEPADDIIYFVMKAEQITAATIIIPKDPRSRYRQFQVADRAAALTAAVEMAQEG